MRRWLGAAGPAAALVGVRPELWLPGALAWLLTVGWIPFLVAVGRPPSVGELTHLGAGIVTSGAWPLNAILLGTAVAVVVFGSFALVAIANDVLLAQIERRRPSPRTTARLLATSLLAAVPGLIVVALLLVVASSVVPQQINAPDDGRGPLLRSLVRLAPLLVLLAVAVLVGASLASVVGRGATEGGEGVRVRGIGSSGVTQALVGAAVEVGFATFCAILLGVLWVPIGTELAAGRIDLAGGVLLVGFVAIWLCLVLAGGAIRAWSALTWAWLLGNRSRGPLGREAT